MRVLCIETGTDTCSVGVAKDGVVVELKESHGERDHAARVAVYAREVIDGKSIDAVAVSAGPGSYTGLRIGVSFAKGLCYAMGVPLVGVGSLESLCEVARKSFSAQGADNVDGPEAKIFFIPMIDARRMEVYAQVFDGRGAALTQPEAVIVDEGSFAEYRGSEVYIFGSGAEKCRQVLPWAKYLEVQPSARGMARLAEEALREGRTENVAYFEPMYLKDFVVTTSQKKLF